MLRIVVLAWISAAFTLLTACAASARAPHVLRVGSDLDNRPFAWVDERGEAHGRDVEMMQRLARELGRELVWQRMAFDELLPACERGEIDVVCATLGITEERARRVCFTRPYFATELRVVVRAGTDEPRTLAALAGRRVAGSPGTTSEEAVRARLSTSTGVFDGTKDAGPIAERLLSGEIDAAVMDGPAADALAERSAGKLVVLAEPLASENYALALPKSQRKLCDELDALLERLEPELWALDERWELLGARAAHSN